MERIINFSGIDDDTKIHRYISLSKFMNMIEFNHLVFTRIVEGWDDSWELPLSKVKYIDEEGNELKAQYSISNDIFGQCWTTNSSSDAMWRIYSPEKQGIMISTTVGKIRNLNGVKHGFIGRVHYYEKLLETRNEIELNKSVPMFIIDAFLKRNSFKHEEEIRLVFANVLNSVEKTVDSWTNNYNIRMDMENLIEFITIDPRASDYYVDTIKSYCISKGIKCPVEKSDLYQYDVNDKSNFVFQWKVVDNK